MALLFDSMPTSAFQLSLVATQYRTNPLHKFFTELNERISMLHPDVLALLYHYGACAGGPLLELGPYIGGATVSMARGATDFSTSCRITSIEMGGKHDHPTYPTADIVESLRRNLSHYGVQGRVNLIIGHSHDQSVIRMMEQVFDREGEFVCLVIDANGEVADDLTLYRRFLAPRCYLVIDDYYAPGAAEKEEPTRREVDALERQGVIESFGVYGWGTWFGRLL